MKQIIKKNTYTDLGDNQILQGKGFYISYNPNTSAAKGGLGELFNLMGGLMGSMVGEEVETDGRAETALCVNGRFYILNGDFRKEYEQLVPKGFLACMKFFKAHPELKSGWSD